MGALDLWWPQMVLLALLYTSSKLYQVGEKKNILKNIHKISVSMNKQTKTAFFTHHGLIRLEHTLNKIRVNKTLFWCVSLFLLSYDDLSFVV